MVASSAIRGRGGTLKRHNVKASWDEGWSGKHVHSIGDYNDPQAKPMTVHESDDNTLLFVEMDGAKFRMQRKHKAGF